MNPACTHLTVAYAPIDHPDGTRSDRWACTVCHTRFAQSADAAPPVLVAAANDGSPNSLRGARMNLPIVVEDGVARAYLTPAGVARLLESLRAEASVRVEDVRGPPYTVVRRVYLLHTPDAVVEVWQADMPSFEPAGPNIAKLADAPMPVTCHDDTGRLLLTTAPLGTGDGVALLRLEEGDLALALFGAGARTERLQAALAAARAVVEAPGFDGPPSGEVRKTPPNYATREKAWLERLAVEGVRIVHPDDGWVDRNANTVQFVYPTMQHAMPAPGVLVALGTPEKWRVVMLKREVRQPIGPSRWAFVEQRLADPDLTGTTTFGSTDDGATWTQAGTPPHTLPELRRRLEALLTHALLIVPASLDLAVIDAHFPGHYDGKAIGYPNGSTLRILRGRPEPRHVIPHTFDVALVLTAIPAETLREIRRRLLMRNGVLFAPFAVEG